MSIVTPVATLSYPHLFTPQAPMAGSGPDAKPKYAAKLVFDAEGDEGLKELKAAVATAAKEKFGAKAVEQMRKGKIRSPFRRDFDADDEPEGAAVFITARNTRQPGIVSRIKGADGKPQIVTEEMGVIYPGCKVRAAVSVFAYDHSANKGVSISLDHIQFWDDGERLGGGGATDAADAFEADLDGTVDLEDVAEEVEDPLSELNGL